MVGPTFSNRLFVLSFKNANNDPRRDSFEKYYNALVEVKNVNALTKNHFLINP